MFKEIKDKIYEKLSEINSIAEVKDYADIGKNYPMVVFEPYSWDNKTITQMQNERHYNFKLYIFQEYEKIGKKQAWEMLMQVYDDILEKLNNNLLDGLCNNLEIQSSEFGTTQNTEDGKNVYSIIYISVKVLI